MVYGRGHFVNELYQCSMESIKPKGFIFPLSSANFQKSALGVFTVLYPQNRGNTDGSPKINETDLFLDVAGVFEI